MPDLILRTDFGDFDLFESESIVNTSSIFNLENITARYGEYTNEFNLPLTSNNERIIRHSNFIRSSSDFPYRKVNLRIIISGLDFKIGFLEITSIQQTIKGKFYSGNTNFYDLIKSKNLTDLDWYDFDHVWDYTNAVANASNTEGFIYPVMNYNASPIGSDTLDVRYVLPATYCKEALSRIFSQHGYLHEYNFDTSDLDVAVLPFAKKNPELNAATLLLNSVDVSATDLYNISVPNRSYNLGFNQYFFHDFAPINPGTNQFQMNFNQIDSAGSSSYFNFSTQKFIPVLSGVYDYSSNIELNDYDYMGFVFNENISQVDYVFTTTKALIKVNGVVFESFDLANGALGVTAVGGTLIPSIPQTIVTTNVSGSIYLAAGDVFEIVLSYSFYGKVQPQNPLSVLVLSVGFNPTIFTGGVGNSLDVSLQNALTFGNLITYSSILPKMKCSDYLKDMCVRFGIILNVDEDRKIVYLNKLDSVSENIPQAVDWTDKLDESQPPETKFKYSSYAQLNNIIHSEDKTVTNIPEGTDYVLSIENENLELVKDLYKSPFAPTVNTTYNGYTTAYIDSYNVTTDRFDTDVMPRICFSEILIGQFKFTDGVTTSGFIDAARIWFIDQDVPDLSMGFGINLISKNSQTLVNSLQNLKIVKAKFNLNLTDIYRIDYFTPVYIEQFQSYFFISSINQFDYTNPGLTEVELIKLS